MDSDLNSKEKDQTTVSLDGAKILLMDTNVIQQKLISKMLEKNGCPVILAENYKEAMNILDGEKIDLILLDAQFRKNNGFDIAQIARKKEKASGRRIPIVVLADSAIKVHRDECMAEGLDECLPKPVFDVELHRVIEKLSGNNGRSDSQNK